MLGVWSCIIYRFPIFLTSVQSLFQPSFLSQYLVLLIYILIQFNILSSTFSAQNLFLALLHILLEFVPLCVKDGKGERPEENAILKMNAFLLISSFHGITDEYASQHTQGHEG